MCWLTNAWPSTTSVTVFFRSAPTAKNGTVDRQSRDGAGRVAAGAAQDDRAEGAGATHRIVHAPRDGPLPDQEGVGDAGEPLERVLVFVSDRLAGAVGAGHHQHFRSARGKQQMMQRRVGQHHAEFVVVRRDSRRVRPWPEPERSAAPTEVSSASASGEKARPAGGPPRDPAPSRANGFSLRNLRSRSARDGGGVARIAGQVIAAESL